MDQPSKEEGYQVTKRGLEDTSTEERIPQPKKGKMTSWHDLVSDTEAIIESETSGGLTSS